MGHVSDIKLIRTDTTLDLSQKAEKGMLRPMFPSFFYNQCSLPPALIPSVWDYKSFRIYFKDQHVRSCTSWASSPFCFDSQGNPRS